MAAERPVCFLLDEDTEQRLARYLAEDGHDVARVVEAEALGPGTDDCTVRAYARADGRILITYDDDHLAVDESEHAGVFYCPSQRIETYRVRQIITAVLDQYPTRDQLPFIVFLTEAWLQLRGDPVVRDRLRYDVIG